MAVLPCGKDGWGEFGTWADTEMRDGKSCPRLFTPFPVALEAICTQASLAFVTGANKFPF